MLEIEAETMENAVAEAVDAMDHNREWHITVDEVGQEQASGIVSGLPTWMDEVE